MYIISYYIFPHPEKIKTKWKKYLSSFKNNPFLILMYTQFMAVKAVE